MTNQDLTTLIQANFTLPPDYDLAPLLASLCHYDLDDMGENDLIELIDGELFALNFKP